MGHDSGNIEWLAASGQDWANYTGRFRSAHSLLQAVLTVEGHPDPGRLERAVRLAVEAEPVLGCRFAEHPDEARWEKLEQRDGTPRFRMEEPAEDEIEERIGRLLCLPLEDGHQMEAVLLKGAEADRLVLRLDHACCDGGGLKACLRLLAELYSRLEEDHGYAPPKPAGGDRRRDSGALLEAWGITDIRAAYRALPKPQPAPVTVPFRRSAGGQVAYAVNVMEPPKVAAVREQAVRSGCTVNDVLLFRIFRAMRRLGYMPESCREADIMATVDLRRYLPQDQREGIFNLSGFMRVRAGVEQLCDPEKALADITGQTSAAKAGQAGLDSVLSMELMRAMPYSAAKAAVAQMWAHTERTGLSVPIFSNLGRLAGEDLHFGKHRVTGAYSVLPAMRAPAFLLGASFYGERLVWSAGFYSPERTREDAEALLRMLGEA